MILYGSPIYTKHVYFEFQSRDKLVRVLQSMNAGDAVDQVLRQVDKFMRNNERSLREARINKVLIFRYLDWCLCYDIYVQLQNASVISVKKSNIMSFLVL